MADAARPISTALTASRWERLVVLFDEALAHPADERSAFLTSACLGDEALRSQIDSLLEEHMRGAGPLDQVVSVIGASPSTPVDDTPGWIGHRVGPYTILREIGRGGMGVVFLARRTDGQYEREVALKVVQDPFHDERERDRFLVERQILADLSHRGIAQLFDGGLSETGLPYFTMEHVDGLPIDAYCDRHELDVAARLHLFVDVCHAVSAAHRKRIVHRDLKPGNILVTAEGAVKLVDFGIAKPLANAEGHLTRTGGGLFTPDYASPEQVRNEPVTPATDVYSLGAVLYQLLTGVTPHQFTSRTPADVERTICEREPTRPSLALAVRTASQDRRDASTRTSTGRRRPRDRAARQLAGDLDMIVLKALQKEPARRYTSVDAMRQDIVNHLGGRPVSARPDSLAYRGRKFAERHRTSIAAAALVLTSAAVAAVAALTLSSSRAARIASDAASAPVPSIAVLPFRSLGPSPVDEPLQIGMADAVITRLSGLKTLSVRPTSAVSTYSKGPRDPIAAGQRLRTDYVLDGSIQRSANRVRLTAQLIQVDTGRPQWAETFDESFTDLFVLQDAVATRVARQLVTALTVEDRRALVRRYTADVEAYDLYLRGRFFWERRTETDLRTAIRHFEEAVRRDPQFALAYAGLADSYLLLANLGMEAPRNVLPALRSAAMKAVELDDGLAEAHTAMSSVHGHDWNWPAQEAAVKRAIEVNPNYPTAYNWYGFSLEALGREQEGLAMRRRAYELDPLSIQINVNLARALYANGYEEDALRQIARTLELDPHYWDAHHVLGLFHLERRRYPEAIGAFEKSGKLASLGHAFAMAGNRERAGALLRQLERESARRYVTPLDFAVIYAGLGHNDRAFESLERAFRERIVWVRRLDFDVRYAPLRGDPRYADLMRRIRAAWLR